MIESLNISELQDLPEGVSRVVDIEPVNPSDKNPVIYVTGMGSSFEVVQGVLEELQMKEELFVPSLTSRVGEMKNNLMRVFQK